MTNDKQITDYKREMLKEEQKEFACGFFMPQ